MSKPFALSVKALVLDEQGRCLILRRSASSKNNAGKWDFPGGKVDSGEAFDIALRREIQEETGLSVELARVLGAAESPLPDRTVAYLMMEARVTGGQVQLSEEHDGHKWVEPERLVEQDICPQFRAFMRNLGSLER